MVILYNSLFCYTSNIEFFRLKRYNVTIHKIFEKMLEETASNVSGENTTFRRNQHIHRDRPRIFQNPRAPA